MSVHKNSFDLSLTVGSDLTHVFLCAEIEKQAQEKLLAIRRNYMAVVEYQSLLKQWESKRICGCLCQPVIPTMVPSIHLLRQLFMIFDILLFICSLLASLFPYPHARVGGRNGM